jgi:hypothetical protein
LVNSGEQCYQEVSLEKSGDVEALARSLLAFFLEYT